MQPRAQLRERELSQCRADDGSEDEIVTGRPGKAAAGERPLHVRRQPQRAQQAGAHRRCQRSRQHAAPPRDRNQRHQASKAAVAGAERPGKNGLRRVVVYGRGPRRQPGAMRRGGIGRTMGVTVAEALKLRRAPSARWRSGVGAAAAAGCVAIMVLAPPSPAAASARTATLKVLVSGLPFGQRPAAVLAGPGLRRTLSSPELTLPDARPGWYTLTVNPLKLTRGQGRVLRGATAYPAKRRVRVRVRAGATATLSGAYGTIVNPGLRALRTRVVGVSGPPAHPRSVRLAGRPGLAAGEVLSLPPSAALPDGVLGRVRSLKRQGGSTVVALEPVSVFDVVPAAQFDVPVHLEPANATENAALRPHGVGAECGPSIGPASGVYRTVNNPTFSGGWNTVSLFGRKVPIGLKVALDADMTAGVQDLDGVSIGVSCEADLQWNGMVGPVPVTGGVFGDVHASVGAGVGFQAQVSAHVHAGAATAGVPPALVWVPQVSISNLSSPKVQAAGDVSVTAGFGAGVDFGIGTEWPGDVKVDVTINLNNDWDFTAQASYPDGSGCTTQAKFASFDAEADLGPWTVQSPSTPPLFTWTLWGPTSCEPQPSPPPPSASLPAPSPQPAPAPTPPPPAAAGGYGLVSCVSTSLCRAVWGQEEPTDGSAWNAYTDTGGQWSGPLALGLPQPPALLEALSCAPSGFCLAFGESGDGVATTGGGWYSIPSAGDVVPYNVSCVSQSFCVAVRLDGDAVIYDGSSWGTPVGLAAPAQLTGVSCSSSTFCVATDSAGAAFTYDGGGWSAPTTIDSAGSSGNLDSHVSCASATLCVAVANDGNAEVYDGTSWSAPRAVITSGALASVSCAPGTSFCAVVDSSGEVDAYRSGAWSGPAVIDPGSSLTSVSCASSTTCVAVDTDGRALTYNGSAWSAASFVG
jgi:hypothetical protein